MQSLQAIAFRPRRRQAEIRELRRTSLLRDALVTVAEFDIEGATVACICTRAGASRGLWNSLATGKDNLKPERAIELCDIYIEGCLET